MKEEKYNYLKEEIENLKAYVFPRTVDNLILVGSSRVYKANDFVVEFLEPFWIVKDFDVAFELVKKHFKMSDDEVINTLNMLLEDLIHLAKNELHLVKHAKVENFNITTVYLKYPVMAEIALTDRCNNRCKFCFWGVGQIRKARDELSTEQVKTLIRKVRLQARVASLHFTGGEPTLREDLPELISYARSLGLRAILLTNGRLFSSLEYAKRIVEAGINGIQISLEADNANLHDKIVGVKGAFEETVQGIQNLLSLPGAYKEFWVHTNTTINRWNVENVINLPYFLKEIGVKAFSMNMVIWSGNATIYKELGISYTEIGDIIVEIKQRAKEVGLKFDWYSPTPVCLFNPVVEGFGIKGCAAANGLLSIDAQGYVLPCSSFPPEYRIGNLLEQEFEEIWFSEAAKKWRYRKHEFIPDVCKTCRDFDVCGGACPLYWINNPFKEKDLRMMEILRPEKNIVSINKYEEGKEEYEEIL